MFVLRLHAYFGRSSRRPGVRNTFQTQPPVLPFGPVENLWCRKLLILQTARRHGKRVFQGFCPHEHDRSARGTEMLLKPFSG